MEAVERQFIDYPKQNENTGDKSDCQAENIYECVTFMTKEIAERGFQVILKHITNLNYTIGLVNPLGNNRASYNHLNQLHFQSYYNCSVQYRT